MTVPRKDDPHVRVMPREVSRYLVSRPDGTYVDLTAGIGGHLGDLSDRLDPRARLFGFEIDECAARLATERLASCPQAITIVRQSYVSLKEWATEEGIQEVDGFLLDLGLSSLQLDDPERGFSFRSEATLDMRFDQSAPVPTAADLIATLDREALRTLLREYGEERQAAQIASALVKGRQKEMIRTTRQLEQVVASVVHPRFLTKSLARVFQALRIAVNTELDNISRVLPMTTDLLAHGGRLVVISYHSLEDRLVKRFMQSRREGIAGGDAPSGWLVPLTKKIVLPSEEELQANPRSRSAKLRAAEWRTS